MKSIIVLLALAISLSVSPAVKANENDIKTFENCTVVLNAKAGIMTWFCISGNYMLRATEITPLSPLEMVTKEQYEMEQKTANFKNQRS